MNPNPTKIGFTIAPDTPPTRVDRWLAEALSSHNANLPANASISRSRIKTLILDGNLACDGKVMRDPSASVAKGQHYELTIPPPQSAKIEPQNIPLDILFEDGEIIVINKPPNLVTHPAPGNPDGTLVNALIAHCGESLTGIGGEKRPGIVHRLDKDTSGVMVAAKTASAHQYLTELFAKHDIERRYTAVVWGVPKTRQIQINEPIGRSPHNRKKMAINPKGREAITLASFTEIIPPLASIAECQLKTGRTHQIRVHLASIGHSVIGDATYAKPMRKAQMPNKNLVETLAIARDFPRQALHAHLLGFTHPVSNKSLRFTAPLPSDMTELIAILKKSLLPL